MTLAPESVLLASGRGLRTLAGRPPGAPAEAPVRHVAATDGRFAAALDDGRIVTGPPGGPWTTVAERPEADLTCVASGPGGLRAGTAGAHLLRVTPAGLERVDAFEDAPTRPDWHTPWGGPPAVRSLAADDRSWYVNVHVGGILREDTDDTDGTAWHATIDLATDVHEVVVDPDSGALLAACGAAGLAVSRDRGASWRHHTDGLEATYCRAVAVTDGTVLLSASTGPRPHRAAVHRRPLDDAGPFEPCPDLPGELDANVDTGCLAAAGPVAAAALPDGRVFVSEDAGTRWRLAAEVPDVRAVAVLDR